MFRFIARYFQDIKFLFLFPGISRPLPSAWHKFIKSDNPAIRMVGKKPFMGNSFGSLDLFAPCPFPSGLPLPGFLNI